MPSSPGSIVPLSSVTHPTKHATALAPRSTESLCQSYARDTRAHGDFLELRPANKQARQALQGAIEYIQGESSRRLYHSQFLVIEPSSVTTDVSEGHGSDSDTNYDTDDGGNDRSPSEPPSLDAFFRLSLNVLPSHPSWRIGKGSSKAPQHTRDVDILLVRPHGREARNFAAIHAAIHIHLDSGAVVLSACSKKPVLYYEDDEAIELRNPAQRVLYKKTNRIGIGGGDYTVKIGVSDKTIFERDRNQYLKVIHNRRSPHPKLDPIPQLNHRRLGNVIIHNSLSYGAFGWVYAGVDSCTGQPIAVKEIRIYQTNDTKQQVLNEVTVARFFQEKHRGLIQTKEIWCEHGTDNPCGETPETVYISSELGLVDFDNATWDDVAFPDRLVLFRDLLEGTHTLHKKEWMHRDITKRNSVIISWSPLQAALIDFGKLIQAEESDDTRIGPPNTLPPEVWGPHSYKNKLDIWMLSYTYMGTFNLELPHTKKANEGTHSQLLNAVEHLLKTKQITKPFADLLQRMLALDPQRRISAGEALDHPCWKDMSAPEDMEDRNGAQLETLVSDTGHRTKRKSHPTQTAVQSRSPPADRPFTRPLAQATSNSNSTLLAVWETHHVSSEESPSDSQDGGAAWRDYHAQRRQLYRQTNKLLHQC